MWGADEAGIEFFEKRIRPRPPAGRAGEGKVLPRPGPADAAKENPATPPGEPEDLARGVVGFFFGEDHATRIFKPALEP